MDEELDAFKSRIDLREYAATLGYQLDRRESSRCSSIMRNAAGDKVVIKRNGGTGHFIFFRCATTGTTGRLSISSPTASAFPSDICARSFGHGSGARPLPCPSSRRCTLRPRIAPLSIVITAA